MRGSAYQKGLLAGRQNEPNCPFTCLCEASRAAARQWVRGFRAGVVERRAIDDRDARSTLSAKNKSRRRSPYVDRRLAELRSGGAL